MSENPTNPHFGSSFDDWPKQQGNYQEMTSQAVERMIVIKRRTYRLAPEQEVQALPMFHPETGPHQMYPISEQTAGH